MCYYTCPGEVPHDAQRSNPCTLAAYDPLGQHTAAPRSKFRRDDGTLLDPFIRTETPKKHAPPRHPRIGRARACTCRSELVALLVDLCPARSDACRGWKALGGDVGRRGRSGAAPAGEGSHLSSRDAVRTRVRAGLLVWLVHLVVGANALQLSRPVGPT